MKKTTYRIWGGLLFLISLVLIIFSTKLVNYLLGTGFVIPLLFIFLTIIFWVLGFSKTVITKKIEKCSKFVLIALGLVIIIFILSIFSGRCLGEQAAGCFLVNLPFIAIFFVSSLIFIFLVIKSFFKK